jgi:hypothetical protein
MLALPEKPAVLVEESVATAAKLSDEEDFKVLVGRRSASSSLAGRFSSDLLASEHSAVEPGYTEEGLSAKEASFHSSIAPTLPLSRSFRASAKSFKSAALCRFFECRNLSTCRIHVHDLWRNVSTFVGV